MSYSLGALQSWFEHDMWNGACWYDDVFRWLSTHWVAQPVRHTEFCFPLKMLPYTANSWACLWFMTKGWSISNWWHRPRSDIMNELVGCYVNSWRGMRDMSGCAYDKRYVMCRHIRKWRNISSWWYRPRSEILKVMVSWKSKELQRLMLGRQRKHMTLPSIWRR